MFGELKDHCLAKGFGGFLPAIKQIANVAALPGIVKASLGMPDLHSGYGFAIGNVAGFDMEDPDSIVSPGDDSTATRLSFFLSFSGCIIWMGLGGVGFDINCGVRLLRTNLMESEVTPMQEQLGKDVFIYYNWLKAANPRPSLIYF